MNRFAEIMKNQMSKLGGKFQAIKTKVSENYEEIKGIVRSSHLFAKTKEKKKKAAKKLYHVTKELQRMIGATLNYGHTLSSRAGKQVTHVNEVMKKLLPQMLHFIKTGFVAKKKIIHLQMSDLYSIVRGKAGKKVEFGLKWGINRIKGGFIQGSLMGDMKNASDQQFCVEAIRVYQETFGKVPKTYGYDRGGYSKSNIKKLKKMGVKNIGVAPKANANWEVSEKMPDYIKKERVRIEGNIGNIKRFSGTPDKNEYSSVMCFF